MSESTVLVHDLWNLASTEVNTKNLKWPYGDLNILCGFRVTCYVVTWPLQLEGATFLQKKPPYWSGKRPKHVFVRFAVSKFFFSCFQVCPTFFAFIGGHHYCQRDDGILSTQVWQTNVNGRWSNTINGENSIIEDCQRLLLMKYCCQQCVGLLSTI